jgi:CheY-like chemotaxis protein
MRPGTTILIAEDDETDVFFLQRAFEEAGVTNSLHITRDGQECIAYLEESMRLASRGESALIPGLLLLDLKMPRMTGFEVLRWRRAQSILCTLPVIVFSASGNQQDVELAYLLGANAFIVKPATLEERTALMKLIDGFWLKSNCLPLMCTEGLAATIKFHGTNGFRRVLI